MAAVVAHVAPGRVGPGPAAGAPRWLAESDLRAWRTAAAALRHPEETVALGEGELDALLALLEEQRALPLFVRALLASSDWAALGEQRRAALDQWRVQHEVVTSLALEEVAELVSSLAAAGLRPVVLKGAAVACRFYDAPELRPFADADLLFAERADAERAFAHLRAAGYVPLEQGRGGDPWLWSRHLPELRHPHRLLHVECHGGLVFAPRDRRHRRERVLLQGRGSFALGGARADALSPEASIVYAFAHAFVRHGGEPHALAVLLDADAIVRHEAAAFRWGELERLADEAGFAVAVATGLAAVRHVLGVPVPDATVAWGDARLAGAGGRLPSGGSQRVRSAGHLAGILHADSLGGAASMLFFSTFPAPAFMRWRYADKSRWPLPLLYAYRWWVQARKAAALALGGRAVGPR